MSQECFDHLCHTIIHHVSEKVFKSEKHLRQLDGKMYRAHQAASGGYVLGKIKGAVTLRMLAGGSYTYL